MTHRMEEMRKAQASSKPAPVAKPATTIVTTPAPVASPVKSVPKEDRESYERSGVSRRLPVELGNMPFCARPRLPILSVATRPS